MNKLTKNSKKRINSKQPQQIEATKEISKLSIAILGIKIEKLITTKKLIPRDFNEKNKLVNESGINQITQKSNFDKWRKCLNYLGMLLFPLIREVIEKIF